MRSPAAVLALCAGACAPDPDVGFLDWFKTDLNEVTDKELQFTGSVPEYVNGVLAQSGPGRFEMGDEHFGHALDGFAKINRYNFGPSAGGGVAARFSASFLQSKFYQTSVKKNKIAASMLAAETVPPTRAKLGPASAAGANDNNYIKPREIIGQPAMGADTAILLEMSPSWDNITEVVAPFGITLLEQKPHMDWKGKVDVPGDDHLCMMATFAHGAVDPQTGDYLVATSCNALVPTLYHDYQVLFKIPAAEAGQPRAREAIASIKMPKGRLASYMHQNAVTENYYIMISVPCHMDMPAVLQGKGLAEGALSMPLNESTIFHIISKQDGAVRTVSVPGFQMGHVINAYEEGGDIVIDITYYSQSTGGFFPRYSLKVITDKAKRDAWPRGSVMRYRLKADGTCEQSNALPDEPEADVELPAVNPNFDGKKYCVFYACQFNSGSRNFAHIAYVKRNLCTGEKVTILRPNQYPSEHQFIPRPGSTAEDDGVLVGLVFDGETKRSRIEVLDGRTLAVVADAPLDLAVPFPIHATWFPALPPPSPATRYRCEDNACVPAGGGADLATCQAVCHPPTPPAHKKCFGTHCVRCLEDAFVQMLEEMAHCGTLHVEKCITGVFVMAERVMKDMAGCIIPLEARRALANSTSVRELKRLSAAASDARLADVLSQL